MSAKRTRRSEHPKFKDLNLVRFLPNIATMMALCTGLTGIHFSMMGRYEMALAAVVIAGVFDILDGRIARMLGVESEFGAELDSLSDFVSFGVVPAVITYMWSLHHWKGWGWGLCLFFVVCSGWRLARFNTMLRKPDNALYRDFFMGIPAPMGAYIALLPMLLGFAFGFEGPFHQLIYGVFLVGGGLLMVSAIPTFSTKKVKLSRRLIFPVLVGTGIAVMALLNAPWAVLSLFGVGYLISLPLSYRTFVKRNSKRKKA